MTHDPDPNRMAQHFERMNEPRRGNPVAVVLLLAARKDYPHD